MRRRIGLSLLSTAVIGAATVLPGSPAQAAYPGGDGKIAYVIISPDGTSHDIWTVNADTTGNRRITNDGKSWHPRWSPDGTLIAFERNKDIYVMSPTGKNVRRVTHTGRAHQPTWSPNGKRIAFINVPANGHGDIYTVAASGGAISRITHDAASTCGDDRPTWSPLGGEILYRQRIGSDCHNRIVRVSLSTGTEHLVIEDGAFGPGVPVADPDFMPDGQHVVFMAFCFRLGDCGTHSWNAVVVDLNGANPQFLTSSDGTEGSPTFVEVAGAPDGLDVTLAGTTWPGDPPVKSFVTTGNREVEVDLDTVGTITQPDWQPLP